MPEQAGLRRGTTSSTSWTGATTSWRRGTSRRSPPGRTRWVGPGGGGRTWWAAPSTPAIFSDAEAHCRLQQLIAEAASVLHLPGTWCMGRAWAWQHSRRCPAKVRAVTSMCPDHGPSRCHYFSMGAGWGANRDDKGGPEAGRAPVDGVHPARPAGSPGLWTPHLLSICNMPHACLTCAMYDCHIRRCLRLMSFGSAGLDHPCWLHRRGT